MWLIFQVFKINVTSISLIPEPHCKFESIRIYDGSDLSASPVQNYCGHVPPCPVVTNTSSVLIVVTIADISNFGGFSLEVEEVLRNYTLPETCETGWGKHISMHSRHNTISWECFGFIPQSGVLLLVIKTFIDQHSFFAPFLRPVSPT